MAIGDLSPTWNLRAMVTQTTELSGQDLPDDGHHRLGSACGAREVHDQNLWMPLAVMATTSARTQRRRALRMRKLRWLTTQQSTRVAAPPSFSPPPGLYPTQEADNTFGEFAAWVFEVLGGSGEVAAALAPASPLGSGTTRDTGLELDSGMMNDKDGNPAERKQGPTEAAAQGVGVGHLCGCGNAPLGVETRPIQVWRRACSRQLARRDLCPRITDWAACWTNTPH